MSDKIKEKRKKNLKFKLYDYYKENRKDLCLLLYTLTFIILYYCYAIGILSKTYNKDNLKFKNYKDMTYFHYVFNGLIFILVPMFLSFLLKDHDAAIYFKKFSSKHDPELEEAKNINFDHVDKVLGFL